MYNLELEAERANKAMIIARRPVVMYVTGGGTQAISSLLNKGGASAYMMESVVNYGVESTHEILGYKPKHYASSETAIALAMRAYQRSVKLSHGNHEAVGIGATSKLKAEHERVGREHEIHVAIQSQHGTIAYSAKPNFSREMEESINTDMILSALYRFFTPHQKKSDFAITHPLVDITYQDAYYPLMLYKQVTFQVMNYFEGNTGLDNPMIFPGSFNPVHHQHLKVAETVYNKTGKKPWFEISIENTDKPMIDAISLKERLRLLDKAAKECKYIGGVLVTTKPMFVDKAKQYKSPTFVVGVDTINRVYDPHYYADAAQFLERKDLKFLVFPRKGYQIRPELLNNPNIEVIPESEYADDGTSSTLIRSRA